MARHTFTDPYLKDGRLSWHLLRTIFKTPESYECLIEIEKQILEQGSKDLVHHKVLLLLFHRLFARPSNQGTVAGKAGTQHPEVPCVSV